MKDKLVIDIETKDTFEEVGGRDMVEKLNASLACVYSYNNNQYYSFREGEWDTLAPALQNARLIIGFSINRFDLPVLKKHFPFNLMSIARYDLLEEIELAYGSRISLDILAQTNLGTKKTGHGLQAIEFYKQGDWKSLIDYCIQDVKITKDLYELVKKQGYLNIPKRHTNELIKVPLSVKEAELPASLF